MLTLGEDNSIYDTQPGGAGAQNVTAMLILHSITTLWSGSQVRNTEMGESNEARELKVKGGGRRKTHGMDETEARGKWAD